LKAIEAHFVPKISGLLKSDYRKAVLSVQSHGAHYTRNHLISLVHIEPVSNLVKQIYLRSAYVQAKYVGGYIRANRIKKFRTFGVSLEDLAPVIDQYFEIYLLRQSALPITETTRNVIIKHLLDEVDKGKDLGEVIRDFNDLAITGGTPNAQSRAVRIARTESTKALSLGGLIGAYMTGVDVDKNWITNHDARVRGANPEYPAPFPHTILDRSMASLFDSFYNGEDIMFPGDPKANPANIINCRCAMLFTEKENGIDEDTNRSIDNFLNDMRLGSI
jgi:hypothetical protein